MGKKKDAKVRGIGIIPKLVISFLVLSCVPLIFVGYITDGNLREAGLEATQRAEEMGAKNLMSAKGIGRFAVEDSVRALDEKATEAIKVRTVDLALDHIHIMEFTDHLVPTQERYSVLSDAGSGNYTFMWDDQDQCISHPRDFFICGYDPATGEEVPGRSAAAASG